MWDKRRLPRLPRNAYQGRAYVFWTFTIEKRRTGWLTPAFHFAFQDRLLHCLSRYWIACPAYVLMPDHMHFIWIGAHQRSDQFLASRYFRKELNYLLAPESLQKQPHDHVLREEERQQDRFAATCDYIRENPVRAQLAKEWQDWPYSGSGIPGYPRLADRTSEFRESFWKSFHAYQRHLEENLHP